MDTDHLEVEQLQQYLDKARNEVRSDIKMYKSQLEKNYLDFFNWHADDLYKACYMDNQYRIIQQKIDTAETPRDIEAYLKRCTLYFIRSARQEKYQSDIEYGPFSGDRVQTETAEGFSEFE